MAKYTKCLLKRGGETQEVLLPFDRAKVAEKLKIGIGRKLKIKEPDQSALWEVVELKDHVSGSGES